MIQTSSNLLYVQGRTILTTRKGKINAIGLNNTYVQRKLWNNDVSIMYMVNTQLIHKVTAKQKVRINCVWMYLGVQYIREISTVNGDGFAPGILDGKMKYDNIDSLNYKTTLTTPTQPKPNTYSWKLWSKLLTTLFSPLAPNRLRRKLGKWHQSHSACG